MRVEARHFNKGKPDEKKFLVLIAESGMESLLLDEYLGDRVPVKVVGEVRLSSGYDEHYIMLEKAR